MRIFQVLLLFVVFNLTTSFSSNDWGKKGHRVIGEIAENYLSKKAKKEINKLLNGYSLAFISNYGDEIKSDNKFRKYSPWHYVNFPFDGTYEDHPKSKKGNLILGIQTCIDVLKNDNSTKEEKIFHLKMLVHFIGDLHQPLHVGIADDKGGNDFQVRWFNKGTNLHSVWDTKMIENYGMSYSEFAKNSKSLSKNQLKEIQEGTIIDWMYESRALCNDIYSNTKIGDKLMYRYSYIYMDTVRFQLQKGGIRLAEILNQIFI